MIIAGNSNVSTFQQRGLIPVRGTEPVAVSWVGALKVSDFFNGHASGSRIRELFAREDGWRFLCMGTHDLHYLTEAASQHRLNEAYEHVEWQYKRLFRELAVGGKFAWLVFPQPSSEVVFSGITPDDILALADHFYQNMTKWCQGAGIPVINPLDDVLGPNGRPQPQFLQRDGIHLNGTGAEFYLSEMSKLVGCELKFKSSRPCFEPQTELESFCSLLLSGLNLPAEPTPGPIELERLMTQFVAGLLEQKGLELEVTPDLELIDSGLFDSLDLVQAYTFLSGQLGIDLNFQIDLKSLDTIGKLVAHVCEREQKGGPGFSDFLVSLRGECHSAAALDQLLQSDRRIATLSQDKITALISAFGVAVQDFQCSYGVVYLWLALWAARNTQYQSALELLEQGANPALTFAVPAAHAACYRNEWNRLTAQ